MLTEEGQAARPICFPKRSCTPTRSQFWTWRNIRMDDLDALW